MTSYEMEWDKARSSISGGSSVNIDFAILLIIAAAGGRNSIFIIASWIVDRGIKNKKESSIF